MVSMHPLRLACAAYRLEDRIANPIHFPRREYWQTRVRSWYMLHTIHPCCLALNRCPKKKARNPQMSQLLHHHRFGFEIGSRLLIFCKINREDYHHRREEQICGEWQFIAPESGGEGLEMHVRPGERHLRRSSSPPTTATLGIGDLSRFPGFQSALLI